MTREGVQGNLGKVHPPPARSSCGALESTPCTIMDI